MAESQEDIDALLAEVTSLADEAVSDIVGDADTPAVAAPPAAPASDPPAVTPFPPRDQSRAPAADAPARPRRSEDASRILKLQVPVIVRLAETTMELSEIVSLSTGTIIEFEKPADSELDLMINNKCIGRGLAIKLAENFGLRVTHIGSLRQRIKAMGGA